ncbi:hypothetical protein AMTR_s00074p00075100 [Amborella trichopoda]|uniref:Uncharacterized protein n=1 Tax=Amborella trichopoda TaxID=13333 RepID=W1NPJ6_AMBTC|nr:hypothetical protein AMTR_s00074p00075100 [Amborella trichopoda]
MSSFPSISTVEVTSQSLVSKGRHQLGTHPGSLRAFISFQGPKLTKVIKGDVKTTLNKFCPSRLPLCALSRSSNNNISGSVIALSLYDSRKSSRTYMLAVGMHLVPIGRAAGIVGPQREGTLCIYLAFKITPQYFGPMVAYRSRTNQREMYYDPSMVVRESDIESTANSYQRSGTSSGCSSRQRVAIPWDYGTQPLPRPVVRSPSHQFKDQRSRQSDNRGDPSIPVAPHPPTLENSGSGSATGSSSAHSSCRTDQAQLRASQISVRLAANLSMAQFSLGASQPVVENIVDLARIAQAVLQAIRNPSLG